MSRFVSIITLISCACSLAACSSTKSLWHKDDTSYATTQGGYTTAPAINGGYSIASGRQQENGFKIGHPYNAMGQWYTPTESYSYDETGLASWYGPGFHGKRTANGESYDSYDMTAAHPTLQLPCIARVTNLENGRSVVVRVNDRGPFKKSRLMDVSRKAAELLGMIGAGTAKVRVQVLDRESHIVADAARQGLSPRAQMAMALQPQNDAPNNVQVASADTTLSDAAPLEQNALNVASADTRNAVSPAAALPVSQIAQTDLNDLNNHIVRKFPVQKTSLFIQVGAFNDAGNAQRLAEKLTNLGPTRLSPTTVNGRVFSRVQIGPVATIDGADHLLAKTLAAGYPAARIVVE